ncbi:MAG TPA: YcjF family protein [Clostridia bacterium]
MDNIGKSFKKIVMLATGGLMFLLVLVAFNQTVQIVNFTTEIHPVLGKITLIVLTIIFGLMVFIPIAVLLKFSKAPDLPKNRLSPEYHAYLEKLKNRLRKNQVLKDAEFVFVEEAETAEEVERALAILKEKSRTVVKSNASAVFLTTAISQNGVLDGAFVLASITRMVWQVARIYDQRPSLKQMAVLYGNIAATVLMARGIEDLDLMEGQLEPLIASVLGGSLATLVPGAVTVTNLVVNSITEGSVNALLTLRVGCLAQRYCASTTRPDQRKFRRAATVEACSLLGSMIKENAVIVIKAFGLATKRAAQKLIKRRPRTDAAESKPTVLTWIRIKCKPQDRNSILTSQKP